MFASKTGAPLLGKLLTSKQSRLKKLARIKQARVFVTGSAESGVCKATSAKCY